VDGHAVELYPHTIGAKSSLPRGLGLGGGSAILPNRRGAVTPSENRFHRPGERRRGHKVECLWRELRL
jgi:hypothetical protein